MAGPEGKPPRPATIVMVVDGRIVLFDVPVLGARVRMLLEGSGADLVICDVGALTDPDAVTVDALARMELTARRLGCRVRLRHAGDELRDLLDLAGLGDLLETENGLRLGPGRQTEEREEPRGVEEEGHAGDPSV